MKWIIFDGDEIIGRIYAQELEPAQRCAEAVFPEVDCLRLKHWNHASKKERAQAKKAQLVTPAMYAKLKQSTTGY